MAIMTAGMALWVVKFSTERLKIKLTSLKSRHLKEKFEGKKLYILKLDGDKPSKMVNIDFQQLTLKSLPLKIGSRGQFVHLMNI